MPSPFDPNQFLDAQVDESNERRPPLPVENPATEDGLYTAIIGKEIKTATGIIEKGDNAGRPWVSMIVPLEIQVPQQLQDGLKLQPTVTLIDRVFLDLTPQNTIDNAPGRNRRQRVYREALDLNKPGDIWNWRKACGQPVKVKIEHEVYEGETQDRPGNILRQG